MNEDLIHRLTRRSFLLAAAAGGVSLGAAGLAAGGGNKDRAEGGRMETRIGKGLRRERPRRFVPESADLGSAAEVAGLFEELERESPSGPGELEEWLLRWSELRSALDEEEAVRYILMTCQTDEAEREKAYLSFVEEVLPIIRPAEHRLAKQFLSRPGVNDLRRERYAVLLRDLKNEVEIFREENVPLQTEEAKLSQLYQKIAGAMTVNFEGREQTLQQMSVYLERPDRPLRQAAWENIAERRLRDRDELNRLFNEMLKLRGQIARNAGFANYRDYAFRLRGRFDYGVPECERFHEAVEEVVTPFFRERQERRRQRMKLDRLRPWDLTCDPLGRPPLSPFATAGDLIKKAQKIFSRLDSKLGRQFKFMADHQLLDLISRKGKAPGGYSHSLEELRVPFIFMNAVGLDDDVRTLLHEAGHSFHTMAVREEPLIFYRHAPLEFAEVASMGMEFLAGDYLDEFYSPPDFSRSREDHLEGVISLFGWIATVDAFQHWIYTHPGHSDQERDQAWLELRKRFGGIEDWSGYEPAQASNWHRQIHIFEYPFYYIEYGIAELGALQLWRRARADKTAALRDYRAGLALGGSRPLPQLFAAAGIRFDMSREILEPLIREVKKEIETV